MDLIKSKVSVARNILDSLPISTAIRDIYIEELNSPWNEKIIRLTNRKGCTDVKLYLWKNDIFLYGRIYRLLLYVCDALDQNFNYDTKIIPHGTLESKIRETYNHIWGIYVDSRIDRMGIENFFDKTMRRNLFIDTQRNLPWTTADMLFEKLWNKETYNHPEIIDYANSIDRLSWLNNTSELTAFEIEISRSLMDHTVRKHVDKIVSNTLRDMAYDIVNFAADHCSGTQIEPSYYSIYFMYDQEIFAEMLTTKPDAIHITLFDFQLNLHKTYVATEHSNELQGIKQSIKTIYDKIANHSRLKAMKNPYTVSIEK